MNMNREKMFHYISELNKLGIKDTQIIRWSNGSTTTLWNLRNWTISDKKLVLLWESLDRFWDEGHALHIEASKKDLPLTNENVDMK